MPITPDWTIVISKDALKELYKVMKSLFSQKGLQKETCLTAYRWELMCEWEMMLRRRSACDSECRAVLCSSIRGFTHRHLHLCQACISDLLYVLGGNCDGKVVDTVQSFNISTQTWSTLSSMREKRSNPGASMRGDRIVACGGCNGSHYLATCEQFGDLLNPFP